MRFALKLIAVVWLLGAAAVWLLIGSGVKGQITADGGLSEVVAYSLPGIIFAIPVLLIAWLAGAGRSRP